MKSSISFHSEVAVSGVFFNPDDFSCELGIEPTTCAKAGERPHPRRIPHSFSRWMLSSSWTSSGRPEQDFADLLSRFNGRERQTRDVCAKMHLSPVATVIVEFSERAAFKFHLSRETIQTLSSMGFSFWIDWSNHVPLKAAAASSVKSDITLSVESIDNRSLAECWTSKSRTYSLFDCLESMIPRMAGRMSTDGLQVQCANLDVSISSRNGDFPHLALLSETIRSLANLHAAVSFRLDCRSYA